MSSHDEVTDQLKEATRPERTGEAFERNVVSIITNAGGKCRRHVCFGLTCYGEPWRVDAIVENLAQFPTGLIVECKWQESTGSADEKFPYLVENIRGAVCPAIVVCGGRNARVEGGGARSAALAYLKRQVDGAHLIAVLTTEELISWLRHQRFS